MSGGRACPDKAHRDLWRVTQRKSNMSRFNGGRRTPSTYSEIVCTAPGCLARWRTEAAYADTTPNLVQ